MASLGRMSAGIIHEINNPLNYANQALYLLRTKKDRLPEAERPKYLEIVSDIEDGVGRVQRIVSDLREFTHPHSTGKDQVALSAILSSALRFLSHELKEPVKVEVRVPEDLGVHVDKNKMTQVIVNLVQDSIDALREKKFEDGPGPLVTLQGDRAGDRVHLLVRDNGEGISPENLSKIFDPFFTTKDVGKGMGLGLSICYRIVHEQGGDISVRSEKGKFTEFTLDLPAKG
jgi:two-component system sensor histidine kinase PhcS